MFLQENIRSLFKQCLHIMVIVLEGKFSSTIVYSTKISIGVIVSCEKVSTPLASDVSIAPLIKITFCSKETQDI